MELSSHYAACKNAIEEFEADDSLQGIRSEMVRTHGEPSSKFLYFTCFGDVGSYAALPTW